MQRKDIDIKVGNDGEEITGVPARQVKDVFDIRTKEEMDQQALRLLRLVLFGKITRRVFLGSIAIGVDRVLNEVVANDSTKTGLVERVLDRLVKDEAYRKIFFRQLSDRKGSLVSDLRQLLEELKESD